MSVFGAVNNFHAPEQPFNRGDTMTPTTPRPNTAPSTHPPHMPRTDDATTPTRATFGALASQQPLPPAAAFPASIPTLTKAESDKAVPQRHGSIVSLQSKRSHDVDMDDSDDGDDASDDGSVNPDGSKSSKKKKGQKFYCTEFPPCTLSFTRSEHLARHIRKHTGERPFQCHCSRRFSRLDNLRQHAQTVHVNEDIPTDSLAASGTRFQRQVRSERARPIGNRSRASTVGSQSSGGRGHHRNSLSASSIGSVVSNYSQREDPRRRPPPLPLASDPRARHSLETYNFRPGSPNQFYRPASPGGGFSTPTSTTNSAGQNSPRWTGMQSPSLSHSRTQSLYNGHRTPGRRLSVPSGANPFQSYAPSYGPQLSPLNSSHSAMFPTLMSNVPNSSMASPTSSMGSGSWSRRDSVASMVEGDWRRRTWHPDTHTNFTSSRLNVVTTPNHYQPQVYQYPPPPPPPAFTLASQNTPPHATRLPGIESFDPLRPQTPSRRETSPMAIDTPTRLTNHPVENYRQDDQNTIQQPRWDRSLNQNLSGLEIAPGGGPPQDSARSWASEADRAVQAQAEQVRMSQPLVRFEQPIVYHQQPQYAHVHPQHASAPPITPRAAKRAGWYNGPIKIDDRAHRISPEDSSSPEIIPGTPQSSNVSEYNPSIVHSNGWVEPSHMNHANQDPRTVQHVQIPPQVSASHFQTFSAPAADNYTYAHNGDAHALQDANASRENHPHMPKANNDMHRLETLVAVATGENNATSAY